MKLPDYVTPLTTVESTISTRRADMSYVDKLLSITDAEWFAIENAAVKVDKYNNDILDKRRKILLAIQGMIKGLYGPHHNITKYMAKQTIPWHSMNQYMEMYTRARNVLKKAKEAIATKEKELAQKRGLETVTEEAIVWLQAKGKIIGKDFTLGNAHEIANEIAFHEEVARLRSLGGPFDFSGKNCDECDGWDGNDRRCNCGNRRVDWVQGYGHSFKSPYVVGEAY